MSLTSGNWWLALCHHKGSDEKDEEEERWQHSRTDQTQGFFFSRLFLKIQISEGAPLCVENLKIYASLCLDSVREPMPTRLDRSWTQRYEKCHQRPMPGRNVPASLEKVRIWKMCESYVHLRNGRTEPERLFSGNQDPLTTISFIISQIEFNAVVQLLCLSTQFRAYKI